MIASPVCVVVGVGPGNGASFARRFATAGYRVALCARGGEFTDPLAAELPGARAYRCDVTDATSIGAAFDGIERDLGTPAVVIYNAGNARWGSFDEISAADLELGVRTNATGLLLVAQRAAPAMTRAGHGALIVVGATASRRGGAKAAAFAPAKAAQKSLTESLARALWPAGVHVALIIIDGVIGLATTRARMPDKPDEFFLQPDDIAATALHLATQPRSAWSFEVEARPFGETW